MWELTGLIFPPIIDLINRKIPDSALRFLVAILFCTVAGSIIYYFRGGVWTDFEAWAKAVLTVFGLSQVSYYGYSETKLQSVIRG